MATASAPPVLRVGIEEARGLLAGDFNGFSDPYVQLLMLDSRGDLVPGAPAIKTKIRTKTLNPKWGERFILGDMDVDLRTVTTLRFVVYDWDAYKSDDTLGVVDVPIDDVFQLAEQGAEDWYMVRKLEKQMSKDATGELKLQFTRATAEMLPSTNMPMVSTEEDGSPNLLYVTIDSGKDLLAMDPNHSSDPFVKLSVTGQSFSTTTIEKTLKPHWDERFAFVVRDMHTTLELLVEDQDRTVNDFLGRAQVVLADVLDAAGVEKKMDVKLLNKKLQDDKDRGVLHLRLRWVYDENATSIATSMKKRKTQEQSLLHQLTSRLHLSVPDTQVQDAEDQVSRLNEEQGMLDDESDDEDKLPLPPGAKTVRFAAITIHRAEELPPLDALQFDKEKHKGSTPGGGIDAYVAAWESTTPEDFIRTRIHTRKGRRDELSTSFHETLMLALSADKTTTDITLAVMDWDSVGGDEVVSHVELQDVEALIKSKQGKPFWWNLYGAPLLGVKNKAAVDKMNQDTTAGSTYRGRILLTLKLSEKPATAYDERHQKRAAKKLPRSLFPPSGVFRLRAHFLTAIGLPEHDKYYVALSCGTHEITSTQKAAISRAVEWNETEESDRLVFPLDASQIPDVVLALCTGEWEKRVIVSYARFTAADLLAKGFHDTTVEWVPLLDDPTSEVVKRNEFPGKVLLRLGFGTLATASAQVWDQKAMIDTVNRRVPYQIRVRLQGLKNVAKAGSVDAARKAPVFVRVQCADQESKRSNVVLRVSESPVVFTLDVNLPQLTHASQVLIHLQESDATDAAFIGTLAVSLQEAKDLSGVDASAIVTRCTSEQLKKNTRPQLPRAQWLPLLALDDTVESNQLLASVEIIRKMYPDEKLPVAEPEALESP